MAENELRAAAAALLAKVDTITTENFQRGGERPQREHLRAVLRGDDPEEVPWDVLLLRRLYGVDAEDRGSILELVDMLLQTAERSMQQEMAQAPGNGYEIG